MDSREIKLGQCVVARALRCMRDAQERRRQEEQGRLLREAMEQQQFRPKIKRDEQERVENPCLSKPLNGQEPQPQPQHHQQQQKPKRKRKPDGDEDEKSRCTKKRKETSQQADDAVEEQDSAEMSDASPPAEKSRCAEEARSQQAEEEQGDQPSERLDESPISAESSHDAEESSHHAEEEGEKSTQSSDIAQLLREWFPEDVLATLEDAPALAISDDELTGDNPAVEQGYLSTTLSTWRPANNLLLAASYNGQKTARISPSCGDRNDAFLFLS
ncbi:hypothetical protein BGX27_005871 [Mortierella sp. AM989]|nr:hypothetical protein BGX27_005871 [Mortierella sp. AM989]